jgi:hypothetical protein
MKYLLMARVGGADPREIQRRVTEPRPTCWAVREETRSQEKTGLSRAAEKLRFCGNRTGGRQVPRRSRKLGFYAEEALFPEETHVQKSGWVVGGACEVVVR